jgi:hypothetical protein
MCWQRGVYVTGRQWLKVGWIGRVRLSCRTTCHTKLRFSATQGRPDSGNASRFAAMPSPREVFDDPAKYWTFLTVPNDADFEGQNFDRKELPRGQNGQVSSSDLKEFRHDDVAETVSAFANSNKSGGLLVVGISKTGEVRGVCHLSDGQRTALANVDDLVSDSDAVVKFFDCPSVHRQNDSICLVFARRFDGPLAPGSGKGRRISNCPKCREPRWLVISVSWSSKRGSVRTSLRMTLSLL